MGRSEHPPKEDTDRITQSHIAKEICYLSCATHRSLTPPNNQCKQGRASLPASEEVGLCRHGSPLCRSPLWKRRNRAARTSGREDDPFDFWGRWCASPRLGMEARVLRDSVWQSVQGRGRQGEVFFWKGIFSSWKGWTGRQQIRPSQRWYRNRGFSTLNQIKCTFFPPLRLILLWIMEKIYALNFPWNAKC
jgi:hypothetical protein